jgi:hypothetical protein
VSLTWPFLQTSDVYSCMKQVFTPTISSGRTLEFNLYDFGKLRDNLSLSSQVESNGFLTKLRKHILEKLKFIWI